MNHFNADLVEVFGVVTNTLKVIENVEIGTDNLFVALFHIGGKLD
jgi:hypothetical protein